MDYDTWCIFQTHIERAIVLLDMEEDDFVTRLDIIVNETEPKRAEP